MRRRRLDVEMVRRGLVDSRSAAQVAIDSNSVTVGGAPAQKAARQVSPDEAIEIQGEPAPYVSRAGAKLAHALDTFEVSPDGKRCLDIGASTGGFTDCLLQRGADHVFAVDVGKGQLHLKLRDDPRVSVFEETNARRMQPAVVDSNPVDLVVADVSFISLRLITPAAMGAMAHHGDCIYLVKPQFEATKKQVGKGGIVRDPEVWLGVLQRLHGAFNAQNLYMIGATASPIRGQEGNVEFLAHLRKDSTRQRVTNAYLSDLVDETAAAVQAG